MNQAVVDEDSASLKRRVFWGCLSLYYQSLSYAIGAVLLNTLLLSYLTWNPNNSSVVGIWCLVTVLVSVYRIIITARFFRESPDLREKRADAWYRSMLIGTILSGATWGAAGYLLFDIGDFVASSVVAFVVAGMCAGAIVSLSAFFEASAAFLTLSLLPFLFRLLFEGTTETRIMAVMVALFLLMMIGFARRVNRTVIDGLEMQYLRFRAEETVERQALFDELTGLPNRRLLQDRLGQALARTHRRNVQAALLFLDLDFFKRVNDSLGHSIGDQLLVEVARRMQSLLRSEDTAARLGGDEFVALLTDIEGGRGKAIDVVRRRGEELRKLIETPVNIDGNIIHITVSIGVSMLPGETDSVDDILKHADTAMYRAKDDGRNMLRFFVSEMQEELAARMEIEQKLRSALDRDEELEMYLQPQYDQQMKMTGAEFLLRWHRDGGFISPAEFIPIAEDSGLIYRLGDWVINESCRIGASIQEHLQGREFSLAFNVSPRQFRQKDFVEKVLNAIQSNALPAGLIELELTEGLLIDEVDDTAEKMRKLRTNGLRFSIDDFGTGYSSLRYLKSLPLDTLKVDQSFVRDVLTDPSDASIVHAIISMAKSLELEVIAEGVETAETHRFLVNAGCERFQGFLYSRPIPVDQFHELLALKSPSPLSLNQTLL